ncbi:uncharacterized protein ACDP82_020983 [Pangshura tecta]
MQSPENRKRAPAWTAREVLDLIAIWGEDSVLTELRSKRQNEKVFERISKAMMDKGHSRDSVQCRMKVKELRQAYQKTKEANGRSGAGPKTCRFCAELHAILGGCATSSPPLSLDSDMGVVIAMAEDDADGEEYNEEADEDDIAESTQHSVSPNSQELFLTQMELASQPSQDYEAMEETSAANFSSLPTPSQRLSKIRRRKKKTREEMFSDIMEVTRKERANLNEWKEVVSKYRKDASEREDRRDTRDERWWQEDQQEDQRSTRGKPPPLEDGPGYVGVKGPLVVRRGSFAEVICQRVLGSQKLQACRKYCNNGGQKDFLEDSLLGDKEKQFKVVSDIHGTAADGGGRLLGPKEKH